MTTHRDLVYPRDPWSASRATDLRTLLPTAMAEAAKVSIARLCPYCGGRKSPVARRCRTCWQRQRNAIRRAERANLPMPHHRRLDRWAGFSRRGGRVGTTKQQPQRPMMVKLADGSWVEEEA